MNTYHDTHEAKPKMIETNSRKIVERLQREGFELVSVRGSHHKYRLDQRIVIVPHPEKDLPLGTARNIARQAGWLKGKEP